MSKNLNQIEYSLNKDIEQCKAVLSQEGLSLETMDYYHWRLSSLENRLEQLKNM